MFFLIALSPSLAALAAGLFGHGIIQAVWLLDDSYERPDEIVDPWLPQAFTRLIVVSPALLLVGLVAAAIIQAP